MYVRLGGSCVCVRVCKHACVCVRFSASSTTHLSNSSFSIVNIAACRRLSIGSAACGPRRSHMIILKAGTDTHTHTQTEDTSTPTNRIAMGRPPEAFAQLIRQYFPSTDIVGDEKPRLHRRELEIRSAEPGPINRCGHID